MIIDAHVHIGNSFWGNFTPEFLLGIIGDKVCVCSNLAAIDAYTGKDEYVANKEMLDASAKYPQIKPLYVCEVDRSLDTNIIRQMLKDYPQFVGLKFHPEFTKLTATSEKYDKYLEVARQFKKPCLYHSGHIKSRFSSPALIYQKAKQFPDVPIILGHLSTGPRSSHEEAIKIIVESIEQDTATLYVDVSWVDIEDSIMLIKALKNTSKGDYTHRILWASDAPVGDHNLKKEFYDSNLNAFKTGILEYFNDEELLNNLLYSNAQKLFNL